MECPACSRSLTEIKAGSILVDVCADGCGGVWFDRDEIKKVDETHELEGKDLLKLKRRADIELNSFPRRCPRCSGHNLTRQAYDPNHPLEIDLCWNCGGIWLDLGELESIRKSGGDKEAAGNAFMQSSLNILKVSEKLTDRRRGISRADSIDYQEFLNAVKLMLFSKA